MQAICNYGYVDYRGVSLLVWQLDFDGSQRLAAARTDDERLAIRRAMLSACVEAMAHGDDSDDHLGQLFHEQEQAYLSLVSGYLEHPGVLRDLLELATWEDYGLSTRATKPASCAECSRRQGRS